MIMLEAAKATTETVDALRTGASAMKAMHKSTYVPSHDTTLSSRINYHAFSVFLGFF
jgi:charged multivesicular body protein 4